MTKKLITYASEEQWEILEAVKPHFSAYAAKHGYQFYPIIDTPDLQGRSQHWAKVQLLLEHLPNSEFTAWIDCDFVIRGHQDMMAHLQPDDIQGLVMEQTPHHGVGPNTGLWILRNCPQAMEFLKLVWETGPLPDARLNDQATVAHLLGFSYLPDYTRPVRGTPWMNSISWLPLQWNMLEIFHPEAYLVADAIHFGGMTNQQRLTLIKRQIVRDQLEGWQDHGR